MGTGAFRAASAAVVEAADTDPEALVFVAATAEVLARLARGIGEGPAAGAYAEGVRPVIVLPALDSGTSRHPAVRENIRLLREDGCLVVEDGDFSPEGVVSRVLGARGGPLSGWRVLVTAGGTREPIDSVRFVGNRSSGKMGLALARGAVQLGAEVTVVAANLGSSEPGVEWVPVESFHELYEATLRLCGEADALIMAAAVSDFTPVSPNLEQKIRRSERLTVELAATEDILGVVREHYPELFVVGFAATHGDPAPDAREKLGKKGVDLVVGNDISSPGLGFGSEDNEVFIVGRELERFVPRASKTEVALAILRALEEETAKN